MAAKKKARRFSGKRGGGKGGKKKKAAVQVTGMEDEEEDGDTAENKTSEAKGKDGDGDAGDATAVTNTATVFVCMSNGLELRVQAPLSLTMNDLKRRVEAERGIAWWSQLLFLDTAALSSVGDSVVESDGDELPNQSTVGEQLAKLAARQRQGDAEAQQLQQQEEKETETPAERPGAQQELELKLTMLVDEAALERNTEWHQKCWKESHYWGRRRTVPSRAEPTPTMVAVMRDMILIENFNLAAAEAAGLGDDYKRDIGNSTGCEGYRGDDAEAPDDKRANAEVRKLKAQLLVDLGVRSPALEGESAKPQSPEESSEDDAKRQQRRAFRDGFRWVGRGDAPPRLLSNALLYAQRDREWRELEAAIGRAVATGCCAGSTSQ